jgi:hypothetical protein
MHLSSLLGQVEFQERQQVLAPGPPVGNFSLHLVENIRTGREIPVGTGAPGQTRFAAPAAVGTRQEFFLIQRTLVVPCVLIAGISLTTQMTIMMTDPSSLFEPSAPIRGFDSLEAELDAVRTGKKAMSVFSFQLSSINDEDFNELLMRSFELDLTVIQQKESVTRSGVAYDQIYTFILLPAEAWRVPAYMLTRKALRNYGWSDAAEYLESALLGYSEEETSAWIARNKATRLTWTGKTFYLVMSHQQQGLIAKLGMRCIDPDTLIDPITAFYSRSNAVIKKDACSLLPHNMVIGRVSVKEKAFRKLFGKVASPDAPDIITGAIAAHAAAYLNPALDSNFQFLSADGWH